MPRIASKIKRREETRERKAESAAKVERAIERELIERLRSGAYGDRPLNVEEGVWKKVLRGLERAEKGEELADEEEELEEEDGIGEVEYVSDLEGSEVETEGEMEDFDDWLGGESADEDQDDKDDEDENDEDDSSGSSDEEGSEGDQATKKPGTKRKRQAPPPKARKKPVRVQIEYEIDDLPQREALLA